MSLHCTELSDRGVVSVNGPDAEKLLQGLVTNDMGLLRSETALHAGLLSPQGKILFEFFIVRVDGGFLVDVAREKAPDLVKRLTMYRLRAEADIRDASAGFRVYACWNGGSTDALAAGALTFADPRLPELGVRILASASPDGTGLQPAEPHSTAADYHAHRIRLGVPEGGRDYPFGDAFPHEALFDQVHGVSFTKGCFVGQEIVARMEHRGTARKRVVPVVAAAPLPQTGTEIQAQEVVIGTLGSVAGTQGLALIRLDRAAEFRGKGVPLTAAGVPVEIVIPPWARFGVEPAAQG